MNPNCPVVNVGSHANPPADMWERYFPPELKDLAPRRVMHDFPGEGIFEAVMLEGVAHRQLTTQVGIQPESLNQGVVPFIRSWSEGLPGQTNPAERIAAQDQDGIAADVIVHPGWPILNPKNRQTRWGMMYAFNSWLAEFCSHDPKRLIGIGELPLWDMELAVREARRIKQLGLRGILMPAVPTYVGAWSSPADKPYTSDFYAPLWPVLEELGLVMVIHADAAAATPGLENYTHPGLNMIINKTLPSEMIASLIVAHVFKNHPGLKLVCVETGVGWMAHLISWMDVLVREHPTLYKGLTESPSETFRKHVFGSFLWDTIGVANKDVIGVDNIMWCNDFPHSYGPWPNSRSSIDRDLAGVSPEDRYKILAGNAIRVFGLDHLAPRSA